MLSRTVAINAPSIDFVYPDDSKVWGCDVSFWQDENETPRGIDFNKMKAEGAEFVFIRAGQGPWIDEDFLVNWEAAKEAGLLRGAYWFLDGRYSANTQANTFKSVLTDPGELRPVIDYECELPMVMKDRKGKTRSVPVYNTIVQLNGFLTTLAWPVKPMIYTGFYYWQDHGSKDASWGEYPLWIAGYKTDRPAIPLPWKSYIFWQFADTGPGKVLGAESNAIDMNYFNGSREDLLKYAGKPVTPPPTTGNDSFVLSGKVIGSYKDANGIIHTAEKEF